MLSESFKQNKPSSRHYTVRYAQHESRCVRETPKEDRILSVPPSLLYTPTHILTADLTVETLYQELQNADLINHIAHRFCGGGKEKNSGARSLEDVGDVYIQGDGL